MATVPGERSGLELARRGVPFECGSHLCPGLRLVVISGNSGATRSRSGWSRCGRSRERRLTRSGSGPGRGQASLWHPRGFRRTVVPLERGHPMGCLRGWSSPETRTMCHGGRKRPPDSRLWFGRGASSVITRSAPTLGSLPTIDPCGKAVEPPRESVDHAAVEPLDLSVSVVNPTGNTVYNLRTHQVIHVARSV